MNEPTEKELYLDIAGQCTATATSELAASILVDGGNGTLRQLLNDAADAIRAGWSTPQPTQAQAGAVPLTCEWTHNDDDGFWETACGDAWRFDDGGPKENNMNFCHCCGKTLRIKGGQP